MNRGEVWWIYFNSSQGGEIQKLRPAIIVSNNSSNKHLNRVQVVPLSSNVEKLFPSEAYVNVDKKQSKAMADQLTTVAKQRIKNKAGAISELELKQVERAIKIQLSL